MNIRTRFAPSPSGKLHIGGLRTALFNYLWAKKNNGSFILRLEDTNIKKSSIDFSNDIYNNLKWTNIIPDESYIENNDCHYGPYSQIERFKKGLYSKYIEQLIKEKKAYYCFCTHDDILNEKKEFIYKNKKKNYQYSRKCFFLDKKNIEQNIEKNKQHVIRFLINRECNYTFFDLIHGTILTLGTDIEDFVICRQDKTPLYNFAAVIDDHLMDITHIIRGDDHITNTSKQIAIFKAFNWKHPIFAHIPIILDENKKKISKRNQNHKDNQYVETLKQKGYLPESVVNYILFLGWHPGNTEEFFSLDKLIKIFDIKGLQKSSSIFDINKLNWYNSNYINRLTDEEYIKKSWLFFKDNDLHTLKEYEKNSIEKTFLLFKKHKLP